MAHSAADVVIVGAGHAGVQLAALLVKGAPERRVALLSDEDVLPYERPPLTKRLLRVDRQELAPVLLRSDDYWARSPVDLRLGAGVVDVDAAAHQVVTSRGDRITYGTLVWAAGGSATSPGIPGEDLAGVHSIRDYPQLEALRAELDGVQRAVVVGGGFVGLEVAAGLTGLGVAVSVVETGERLLARAAPAVVSEHYAALHRSHGVDLRLSTGVVGFEGPGGRLSAVALSDQALLPVQLAVVGVGMTPRVGPLLEAGAAGDTGGVGVDETCRTSLADVFAIGDCVRQRNAWSATDQAVRIESVHNASQQAAVVARLLLGQPEGAQSPPRFWSNQFDRELKSVGLPSPDDEIILRGDPRSSSFSAVHLRGERIVGIDTVNRPRDFARAQALIASGWTVADRVGLADETAELPRVQPVG